MNADGNSAEYIFDTTGNSSTGMGWKLKQIFFAANSNLTTILFLVPGLIGLAG
jgi:hypothetical protein